MKRWIILCVILLSQCREKNLFYNNENIYKKEGFSIKLPREYKKISEDEDGVLFSGRQGEISIIFFKENISQIKRFYELTQEPFPLENCKAYLFTEKQRKGFRKIIKIRLEIFPDKKDIQITILCFELEKNYDKIMDILRTIRLE